MTENFSYVEIFDATYYENNTLFPRENNDLSRTVQNLKNCLQKSIGIDNAIVFNSELAFEYFHKKKEYEEVLRALESYKDFSYDIQRWKLLSDLVAQNPVEAEHYREQFELMQQTTKVVEFNSLLLKQKLLRLPSIYSNVDTLLSLEPNSVVSIFYLDGIFTKVHNDLNDQTIRCDKDFSRNDVLLTNSSQLSLWNDRRAKKIQRFHQISVVIDIETLLQMILELDDTKERNRLWPFVKLTLPNGESSLVFDSVLDRNSKDRDLDRVSCQLDLMRRTLVHGKFLADSVIVRRQVQSARVQESLQTIDCDVENQFVSCLSGDSDSTGEAVKSCVDLAYSVITLNDIRCLLRHDEIMSITQESCESVVLTESPSTEANCKERMLRIKLLQSLKFGETFLSLTLTPNNDRTISSTTTNIPISDEEALQKTFQNGLSSVYSIFKSILSNPGLNPEYYLLEPRSSAVKLYKSCVDVSLATVDLR